MHFGIFYELNGYNVAMLINDVNTNRTFLSGITVKIRAKIHADTTAIYMYIINTIYVSNYFI